MQWNGSWAVPEYAGIDEIKDKIDVVEVPSVDGKKSCVIHGLGNCIFSQTKYPDQCWKFVEFLGSKEAMTMQAEAVIDISARSETTHIWVESLPQYNPGSYTHLDVYKRQPHLCGDVLRIQRLYEADGTSFRTDGSSAVICIYP